MSYNKEEIQSLSFEQLKNEGNSQKNNGCYEEALRIFEIAINNCSVAQAKQIVPQMISCYRNTRQPKKAIDLFERLVSKSNIDALNPYILTSASASYADVKDYFMAKQLADRAKRNCNGEISNEINNIYQRIRVAKGEKWLAKCKYVDSNSLFEVDWENIFTVIKCNPHTLVVVKRLNEYIVSDDAAIKGIKDLRLSVIGNYFTVGITKDLNSIINYLRKEGKPLLIVNYNGKKIAVKVISKELTTPNKPSKKTTNEVSCKISDNHTSKASTKLSPQVEARNYVDEELYPNGMVYGDITRPNKKRFGR